jgi:DNA-directed RNA polymerase subunit RPC12/RpoP
MSDRLLKESDVIEAFKGRESLIHDVYTATAIIRSVPSADRPQGEWMHDDSSPIAYRCTACNTLQHWSVIQNGRYRFCPNCGARMKGADDERSNGIE